MSQGVGLGKCIFSFQKETCEECWDFVALALNSTCTSQGIVWGLFGWGVWEDKKLFIYS